MSIFSQDKTSLTGSAELKSDVKSTKRNSDSKSTKYRLKNFFESQSFIGDVIGLSKTDACKEFDEVQWNKGDVKETKKYCKGRVHKERETMGFIENKIRATSNSLDSSPSPHEAKISVRKKDKEKVKDKENDTTVLERDNDFLKEVDKEIMRDKERGIKDASKSKDSKSKRDKKRDKVQISIDDNTRSSVNNPKNRSSEISSSRGEIFPIQGNQDYIQKQLILPHNNNNDIDNNNNNNLDNNNNNLDNNNNNLDNLDNLDNNNNNLDNNNNNNNLDNNNNNNNLDNKNNNNNNTLDDNNNSNNGTNSNSGSNNDNNRDHQREIKPKAGLESSTSQKATSSKYKRFLSSSIDVHRQRSTSNAYRDLKNLPLNLDEDRNEFPKKSFHKSEDVLKQNNSKIISDKSSGLTELEYVLTDKTSIDLWTNRLPTKDWQRSMRNKISNNSESMISSALKIAIVEITPLSYNRLYTAESQISDRYPGISSLFNELEYERNQHVLRRNAFYKNFWYGGSPSEYCKKSSRSRIDVDSDNSLLKILISYVPRVVVRRFMNSRDPIVPPEVESYLACVLLADISGFSKMTTTMTNIGAEGVEKVTYHINDFYSSMITLINEYGGDIVKFAGDALIVIWPTDLEEGLFSMNLLGCQCAYSLQRTINKYLNEDTELRLHIGIGSGPIWGVHVGGTLSRLEFFIAGHPLEQASICELQATPGEIFISPECYNTLEGHVICKKINGNYRLDSIDSSIALPPKKEFPPSLFLIDHLRSYVPSAVLYHLDTHEFLAELRTVSVIFVNLNVQFVDSVDSPHKIQLYIVGIQAILSKYEGTVRQFLIDDKGSVHISAFGLPPLSHEDDSLRAIECTLEIRRFLQSNGVCPSIGLTTGRVFCGAVGSEARREYAMVGDIVNLSARLMSAASDKGGLLVDRATYLSTKNMISYEVLEPIKVKGNDQLIPIYIPIGIKSRMQNISSKIVASEHGFIGRRRILDIFDYKLKQLIRLPYSPGHVLIIEGDPGVGKTRTIEEFRNLVPEGVPFLFSNKNILNNDPSGLGPWAMIFDELLGLERNDINTPEKVRDHVLKQLANIPDSFPPPDLVPSWESIAPLLNTLLALDFEETPTTLIMNDQTKFETLQQLLLLLLQILTTKGSIIALDDADLFDSTTWTFTLTVCQQIKGILFIFSMRKSTPQSLAFIQLLHCENATMLTLEPFESIEAVEFVQHLLGVKKLPLELEKQIEKLDCNPYFLEEAIINLKEGGIVYIEDEEAKLKRGIELQLPSTAQQLITTRLDQLPSFEKSLIKVASVIGQVFSLGLLMNLLSGTPSRAEVLQALRNLIKNGFIVHENRDKDQKRIEFDVPIIRDNDNNNSENNEQPIGKMKKNYKNKGESTKSGQKKINNIADLLPVDTVAENRLSDSAISSRMHNLNDCVIFNYSARDLDEGSLSPIIFSGSSRAAHEKGSRDKLYNNEVKTDFFNSNTYKQFTSTGNIAESESQKKSYNKLSSRIEKYSEIKSKIYDNEKALNSTTVTFTDTTNNTNSDSKIDTDNTTNTNKDFTTTKSTNNTSYYNRRDFSAQNQNTADVSFDKHPNRIIRREPSQNLANLCRNLAMRSGRIQNQIRKNSFSSENESSYSMDDDESNENEYSFKSQIIMEVIYSLMLFSQRRHLHAKIAHWYETNMASAATYYSSIIAYHWKRSEEAPKRAAYWSWIAGQRTLNKFSNQEAVKFFHDCIELESKKTETVFPKYLKSQGEYAMDSLSELEPIKISCVHRKLGQAYFNLGLLANARAHLRIALKLNKIIISTDFAKITNENAVESLREYLIAIESDAHTCREIVLTLLLLGKVSFYACNRKEASYFDFFALRISQKLNLWDELSESYAQCIVIAGLQQQYSRVEQYIHEGRKLAADHLVLLSNIYHMSGVYYISRASWKLTRTMFQTAIELSQKTGDRRRYEEAHVFTAFTFYLQGHFKRALSSSKIALDSSRLRGDIQCQIWALTCQVCCHLNLGNVLKAASKLDQARILLTRNNEIENSFILSSGHSSSILGTSMRPSLRSGDLSSELNYYTLISLLYLAKGDVEGAFKEITKAEEILLNKDFQPTAFFTFPGFFGVPEVFLRFLLIPECHKTLGIVSTKLLKRFSRTLHALHKFSMDFTFATPRYLLLQGLGKMASGERTINQVIPLWKDAMSLAKSYKMFTDENIILSHLNADIKSKRATVCDSTLFAVVKDDSDIDPTKDENIRIKSKTLQEPIKNVDISNAGEDIIASLRNLPLQPVELQQENNLGKNEGINDNEEQGIDRNNENRKKDSTSSKKAMDNSLHSDELDLFVYQIHNQHKSRYNNEFKSDFKDESEINNVIENSENYDSKEESKEESVKMLNEGTKNENIAIISESNINDTNQNFKIQDHNQNNKCNINNKNENHDNIDNNDKACSDDNNGACTNNENDNNSKKNNDNNNNNIDNNNNNNNMDNNNNNNNNNIDNIDNNNNKIDNNIDNNKNNNHKRISINKKTISNKSKERYSRENLAIKVTKNRSSKSSMDQVSESSKKLFTSEGHSTGHQASIIDEENTGSLLEKSKKMKSQLNESNPNEREIKKLSKSREKIEFTGKNKYKKSTSKRSSVDVDSGKN